MSPDYFTLVTLRAVVGFGVAGATVPFDLLAEFTPGSKRGQYLIQINYYWTLGSLFVAGVAWASLGTQGWRLLVYSTAAPVLLASIACIFYMPESPVWLIEKGRVSDAESIIIKAAEANGTPLPSHFALSTQAEKNSYELSFFQSICTLLSVENRLVSAAIWTVSAFFTFLHN